MAGKVKGILGVVLVLVGVTLLVYPQISNWLAQQAQTEVMASYDETVVAVGEDVLAAELDRAYAYNDALRKGTAVVTDPFDPNAEKVTDADYERCLNLAGDGVMGTVSLPSIGTVLPIYHGTAEQELQHGVGHLQGTALPVGGESTHCVIAGHTGLPTAHMFDDLDRVQQGDVFVLSVAGQKLAYRVCDISVVLPEQTDGLAVQEGRDLVTLVTCTPYGKNTHRLLVTGERCNLPDEAALDEASASGPSSLRIADFAIPLAVLASAIVGVAVGVRARRGERAQRR